jgi:hypothetical protein
MVLCVGRLQQYCSGNLESKTNHWVDGIGGSTISKWKEKYQADFAKRADRMLQTY